MEAIGRGAVTGATIGMVVAMGAILFGALGWLGAPSAFPSLLGILGGFAQGVLGGAAVGGLLYGGAHGLTHLIPGLSRVMGEAKSTSTRGAKISAEGVSYGAGVDPDTIQLDIARATEHESYGLQTRRTDHAKFLEEQRQFMEEAQAEGVGRG